jgi:hypothetical protein
MDLPWTGAASSRLTGSPTPEQRAQLRTIDGPGLVGNRRDHISHDSVVLSFFLVATCCNFVGRVSPHPRGIA